MPLDSRAPPITEAIGNAFAGIGTANGTAKPWSRAALDKPAFEYFIASLLLRLAEARRERAKKLAVESGVLPNHSKTPLPVGTAATVYQSALLTVSLKVVPQTDRVNVPGLVADLERAGVAPAVLKRLVKKHTQTLPGAHVFSASLNEG